MSKFLHIIKSCNFKTELVPVVFVDIINILEIAFNNLEIFKSFKFNFLLLDTFFKGKVVIFSKTVHFNICQIFYEEQIN